MKALVFAAGRGSRMRPLSDTTPKPLLQAGGRSLLEWQLLRIARAGIRDVVVNASWRADQLAGAVGDGSHWGLRARVLDEGPTPLETGGGMLNALPLLGDGPFVAVNADIWCDFDLATLPDAPKGLAHLVMVDNPAQHPDGDFVLDHEGRLRPTGNPRLTFAGIGVYRPALLADWRAVLGPAAGTQEPPRFPLAPVLCAAIARGEVGGSHHRGYWTDVGTPARLDALDRALRASGPGSGPAGVAE